MKTLTATSALALFVMAASALALVGGRGADDTSQSEGVAAAAQPSTSTPSTSSGRFRSEPGLDPPRMKIKTSKPRASKKKIFVGSKVSGAAIYASDGEPVWFLPSRSMDFRKQTYRGRPVLTWYQAPTPGSGLKRPTYMIANRAYKTIEKVRPGNGLTADSHEFRLTRRNTAFVTAYNTQFRDLRSVGLSRLGAVSDSIAQEVDVRTGKVLWQWNSLDHVPVWHSYAEGLRRPGNPYDYFHINSVINTRDGNVLITGRSTNAIYKVSRKTGEIIWTLGGKDSDFKMLKGTRFSGQHNAEQIGPNLISLFDNGGSPVAEPIRKQSRGLVLKLNFKKMTAKVHRQFFNPAKPLATQQANMQKIGSNFLVGWGGVPLISEHDGRGRLLFDAELEGIRSFYRAYRARWSGRPKSKVALVASPSGADKTKLWISWNGDSRVRDWQVYAGDSADSLQKAGLRERDGFETETAVPSNARVVKVVGLNAKGKAIGQSAVKATGHR